MKPQIGWGWLPLAGLAWAVVGVLAFGAASVSGRTIAARGLPRGRELAIVVAVLGAAVVLGEPLGWASLAGSALVLVGVPAGSWRWPIRSGPTSVLLPTASEPSSPWP